MSLRGPSLRRRCSQSDIKARPSIQQHYLSLLKEEEHVVDVVVDVVVVATVVDVVADGFCR